MVGDNLTSKGLAILLTGLPSSGKSTIGLSLQMMLSNKFDCAVSLLDGDEVRSRLYQGLGYSEENRKLNASVISYLASEIVKHSGIVICASIFPYEESRKKIRVDVESYGGFLEVYVATPLEECERRDSKGLYAKARLGIIESLTGVTAPYEEPQCPDLRLDGRDSVGESVRALIEYLDIRGFRGEVQKRI